ncbi:MAG: VacB/RNase II family 3'-5' exoribonuclease [Phycisphaeraceae bacterium]|nr:MAG: VacB/RNase II family 3'-5' exoribonuclease [Phycisphaeraceae bacterium]
MALRFQHRVLQHLRHPTYEPKALGPLAVELGFKDDMQGFKQAVFELRDQGQLAVDDDGVVTLPHMPDRGELTGIFRGSAKGFGFVEPAIKSADGDVFIPEHATNGALSGDTVKIEYERDFRREKRLGSLQKQFAGEVIEILKRRRANFTGEIGKQGDTWLAYPDGKELTDPVVVRDAEAKNVKPGDKVVLEIIEYPEGNALPEGVITKVLGEAGRPDVETQAVIAAYSLPESEFDDDCIEQARNASAEFDRQIHEWEQRGQAALNEFDEAGRADITDVFISTIDPPDAKDYDDAISIRRLNRNANGLDGWELGVHIADVAHFIPAGSPLDEEAYERGNSCYLPRLVIPMLPEILSNGICSLQEGVPRFAKTAWIRYDKLGHVKAQGVQQTLIKSRKRMTYLEAQALIDGDPEEAKKHAKTEPDYSDELLATVREMNALAKVIEARRHRQGMISLDLPDVELIFDENGKVVDAEQEDDAYTHKLIEMFMVEANEVVARLFERLRVPLIRRIHPEPVPGDVDHLQKAATVAGYKIPQSPTREEMQGLLDATRGTPAARAVHMAVLRTLTKAEYSPALIGHFALASEAYAHFTSPIRRYADLTVHRAMQAYLRETDNGENRPPSGDDGDEAWVAMGKRLKGDHNCPPEPALVDIGRHITATEQNAEDAERELRQYLVLQLLSEQHIGDVMRGVVTGVTPRGIFVQIDKYLADGMIKKEDLPGDVTRDNRPPRWVIDSKTGALVDAHSGRSYKMGDMFDVVIAAVDLQKRQLELQVADPEGRAAGKIKGGGGLKLTLGEDAGGLGEGKGAGFKTPGGKRRSMKSKRRDKGKSDYRQDRKGKGKRQ